MRAEYSFRSARTGHGVGPGITVPSPHRRSVKRQRLLAAVEGWAVQPDTIEQTV